MRCHICDTDNNISDCQHYSKKVITIIPEVKILTINKPEDSSDLLLLAIHKLSLNKIDILNINEYSFTRKSFEFKNGRFNYSKAVDLLTWAYNSDIMHELANLNLSIN